MNSIFKRAATAVNLMMNGYFSYRREIVMEDGYQMKYWLEKENASSAAPLQLVIDDKLQSKQYFTLGHFSVEDAEHAIKKFNEGEMLSDIISGIEEAGPRLAQLAKVEDRMVYFQYHGYGQTCTPHAPDHSWNVRDHVGHRLAYGS